MSPKVLDVGCGCEAIGDVNVDLFPSSSPHRKYSLNVSAVSNFVLADACHLPFKSKSFEIVNCSHVIEHVSDPISLIKELIRVAKRKVVIKCPHRFSSQAKLPSHIHFFHNQWFHRVLAQFPHKTTTQFAYNKIPFLPLPHEITVEVYLT